MVRSMMLTMALLLHGLIGAFIGLKTFSLLMLTMNLAFVPPKALQRVLGRLTTGRPKPPAAEEERPADRAAASVAITR